MTNLLTEKGNYMRHFSGEFDGMRLLMEDELDLIAGGDGEDGDENVVQNPAVIVVTGQREATKSYYVPNTWDWGGGLAAWNTTAANPEPTDAHSIHVDVKISRALTADEQKAINDLNVSIQNTTNAIGLIPNDAHVTLFNGKTVTGAELKQLWAVTDFVVNDNNFVYPNGTNRSEANYNGGNPVISVNISLLSNYDAVPGGLNYFTLHELGHMTDAGRTENAAYQGGTATADQNERLANDVAWAISAYSGEQILPDSGPQAPTQGGYSPGHPVFTR